VDDFNNLGKRKKGTLSKGTRMGKNLMLRKHRVNLAEGEESFMTREWVE
jgi:hypothetical protein